MLRYSLRTLIIVVAAVAVACAALMNATGWIASTAWTLTLSALALATVVAGLGAPARRGFWAGFAIVGWTYLFVAMGPMDAGLKGTLWTTTILQKAAAADPRAFDNTQQSVYTSYTMAYTAPPGTTYAGPPPAPLPAPSSGAPPTIPPTIPMTTYYPSPSLAQVTVRVPNEAFVQAFQHIGQALWTLLFAFLGGLFGAFIVTRSNRPAPQAAQAG